MTPSRDGHVTAYDPFGETVAAEVAARPNPAIGNERRMRQVAVAVFWTLALLLTAGRVYLDHPGAAQPVADLPVSAAVAGRVAAIR